MRWVELFAGIGGFRLGLEAAGHEVVWANEIDPYACRVYRKRFGEIHEGDIRSVTADTLPEHDAICAGFPCQPVSLAGKRKGEADPRWLWPEVARLIRDLRPRTTLLENTPGLLSSGGSSVLADLAEIGCDAEWDLVAASTLGAPHPRDRVWVVAYPTGGGREGESIPIRSGKPCEATCESDGSSQVVPDADGAGLEIGQEPIVLGQRPAPERDDCGLGRWWQSEPEVVRVVDGFPPGSHGSECIKCLGGAVVPHVVEWIGRRI